MGQWSRDELDDAFRHLLAVTDRCFVTGYRDLSEWFTCYTDDVIWNDLGFGFDNGWSDEIRGLDSVRKWMGGHGAVFPNNAMTYYPVPWYVIDVERGWAVCEWRNRMRDPGTGEVFEEPCYSKLIYGGNRQWRFEADIYNPLRMRIMMSHWLRARNGAEAADAPLPPIDMEWGLRLVHSEQETDQRWSREELENAFKSFVENTQKTFRRGKPEDRAQCFTDDVVYRELGSGFNFGWQEEVRGRAAVAAWLKTASETYPNRHMQPFPISWHVIDPERGWVVFECLNQMEDPGNGQVLQAPSFSRMKYDGKNQWRFREDIYDPMRMRATLARWRETHQRQAKHG